MSDKVTPETLKPLVGKRILVTGYWVNWNKCGPYFVYGPKAFSGVGISVGFDAVTEKNRERLEELKGIPDERRVEVTGVLDLGGTKVLFHGQEVQGMIQLPEEIFYFHVEDVVVKTLK